VRRRCLYGYLSRARIRSILRRVFGFSAICSHARFPSICPWSALRETVRTGLRALRYTVSCYDTCPDALERYVRCTEYCPVTTIYLTSLCRLSAQSVITLTCLRSTVHIALHVLVRQDDIFCSGPRTPVPCTSSSTTYIFNLLWPLRDRLLGAGWVALLIQSLILRCLA
jgi:hypothetical protein